MSDLSIPDGPGRWVSSAELLEWANAYQMIWGNWGGDPIPQSLWDAAEEAATGGAPDPNCGGAWTWDGP